MRQRRQHPGKYCAAASGCCTRLVQDGGMWDAHCERESPDHCEHGVWLAHVVDIHKLGQRHGGILTRGVSDHLPTVGGLDDGGWRALH